jgi:hypothetical protein
MYFMYFYVFLYFTNFILYFLYFVLTVGGKVGVKVTLLGRLVVAPGREDGQPVGELHEQRCLDDRLGVIGVAWRNHANPVHPGHSRAYFSGKIFLTFK